MLAVEVRSWRQRKRSQTLLGATDILHTRIETGYRWVQWSHDGVVSWRVIRRAADGAVLVRRRTQAHGGCSSIDDDRPGGLSSVVGKAEGHGRTNRCNTVGKVARHAVSDQDRWWWKPPGSGSAAACADCRRGVVACVVLAYWLVAAAGRAVGWVAGSRAVPVLGAPANGGSRRWRALAMSGPE